MTKLNVWSIVVEHWDTLRSHDSGARSRGDLVAFAALPVVVGVGLGLCDIRLESGAAEVFIAAFSIFAGLLLNLLLLTHTVLIRHDADRDRPKRREFLRQVYRNVSYSVLTCLVALVALVVLVLFDPYGRPALVLSSATFAIALHFLLTLLMVLKRVHAMLAAEFDGPAR